MTQNLGGGLAILFFDLGKDKNFTLQIGFTFLRILCFLGEYHQAFKNSSFFTDFGYTEGYKKTHQQKNLGTNHTYF